MDYYEIFTSLDIDSSFLNEHKTTMYEHINSSYKVLSKPSKDKLSNRDIYGLNQCIHLATSVVFLGTKPANIKKIRTEIQKQFPNNDPTTIITVSTLFYLLNVYLTKSQSQRDFLKARFSSINWYLDPCTAQNLGLIPIPPQS